jgi:hypothetical protein
MVNKNNLVDNLAYSIFFGSLALITLLFEVICHLAIPVLKTAAYGTSIFVAQVAVLGLTLGYIVFIAGYITALYPIVTSITKSKTEEEKLSSEERQ